MGLGDVIKMLRVHPGCGSAMLANVRAATVLNLQWPINPPLPLSYTAILMRHSRLQWEGKEKMGG